MDRSKSYRYKRGSFAIACLGVTFPFIPFTWMVLTYYLSHVGDSSGTNSLILLAILVAQWLMLMIQVARLLSNAEVIVYEHSVTWGMPLGGVVECPYSQLIVTEFRGLRGQWLVLSKAGESRRKFDPSLQNRDELAKLLKARAGQSEQGPPANEPV